jgi:hypothetical protein
VCCCFFHFGHNIYFNIAELIKQANVMESKTNIVVHYIIEYAQHMKWHVRTSIKQGLRGPGLSLTYLR